MKVMCVINEPWDIGNGPAYGDIDIVVEVINRNTVEYYELERFKGRAFQADMFVPLSDLDETTLVNEEFEEKYCVPVNANVCE